VSGVPEGDGRRSLEVNREQSFSRHRRLAPSLGLTASLYRIRGDHPRQTESSGGSEETAWSFVRESITVRAAPSVWRVRATTRRPPDDHVAPGSGLWCCRDDDECWPRTVVQTNGLTDAATSLSAKLIRGSRRELLGPVVFTRHPRLGPSSRRRPHERPVLPRPNGGRAHSLQSVSTPHERIPDASPRPWRRSGGTRSGS